MSEGVTVKIAGLDKLETWVLSDEFLSKVRDESPTYPICPATRPRSESEGAACVAHILLVVCKIPESASQWSC